jgi:hypothetical protein
MKNNRLCELWNEITVSLKASPPHLKIKLYTALPPNLKNKGAVPKDMDTAPLFKLISKTIQSSTPDLLDNFPNYFGIIIQTSFQNNRLF